MTSSTECLGIFFASPPHPKFLYPFSVDCCTINFPILCEPTSIPAFDKVYCRSTAIFRKHPLGMCWSQGLWAPVVATLALVWEERVNCQCQHIVCPAPDCLPHEPLNRLFGVEPSQVSQTTVTCWSTLLAFGRKVIPNAHNVSWLDAAGLPVVSCLTKVFVLFPRLSARDDFNRFFS